MNRVLDHDGGADAAISNGRDETISRRGPAAAFAMTSTTHYQISPTMTLEGMGMNQSPYCPPSSSSSLQRQLLMGGGKSPAAAANVQDELSQLPRLRARVRHHVRGVIQCLSSSETQAYLEAVRVDADLVQKETDPLQFVRFCDYDLLAGTKRLCLYWTERKRLFGPDRAFLPLTLTGTGALTEQDLLTLRAGFPALLPDLSTGHKCFFFDRRKQVPNVTTENFLRSLFYIFKILAQEELSQVDGAHAFALAVTPRRKEKVEYDKVHPSASLVSKVFPVRLKIHLLSHPNQKRQSFAAEVMNGLSCSLRKYFSAWMNIQLHVETEPNQLRDELLALGLPLSGIPLSVGGQWKYEDFAEWCEEQMLVEHETHKHRLLKKAQDSNNGFGWTIITNSSVAASVTKSNRNKSDTPDDVSCGGVKEMIGDEKDKTKLIAKNKSDRDANRRMADVLRSRRKRERQRVELNSLKQESTQLQHCNQRLQDEHERLSGLVVEAEQCLAQVLFGGAYMTHTPRTFT